MTQTLDIPATPDVATDTMRAAVVTEFGAPLAGLRARPAHPGLRARLW